MSVKKMDEVERKNACCPSPREPGTCLALRSEFRHFSATQFIFSEDITPDSYRDDFWLHLFIKKKVEKDKKKDSRYMTFLKIPQLRCAPLGMTVLMRHSTIKAPLMKKQYIYLNRIAITYKGNPLKVSSLQVLKDFFTYAQPAEHIKAFDEFCLAALHDQYRWRRGSPGNALYYSEQLELLIEAAYLLHQKPHSKDKLDKVLIETLRSFFNYASLAKWKKRHHAFMHAALSKSSVADELSPVIIYMHTAHLKKLMADIATIVLTVH